MNYFSKFTKTVLLAVVIFLGSFLSVSASGVDTTFDPGTGPGVTDYAPIYSVAIQSDGKIIAAGNFTAFNGVSRDRIVRLNSNGSVDTSFVPPSTSTVGIILNVYLQADNKIIVIGSSGAGIARLNTDGSLDTSFDPGTGVTNGVRAGTIQSDGKIIIIGYFTSFDGTARSGIARLNTDGSLDTSFDPGTGTGPSSTIFSAVVQSDNKIIIGGYFTSFDGTARSGIARLNTDGSLDTSFDPGTGIVDDDFSVIYNIILQADQKILIVGEFTGYNGTTRRGIARLNTDASLDTSFNMGSISGEVGGLSIQSDGKFVLSGQITYRNNSDFTGISRTQLVRINTDGSIDTSFSLASTANQFSEVRSSALQSDGQVIVVGEFNTFNGVSKESIVRIYFIPYVFVYAAGQHGSLTGTLSQSVEPGLDGTTVTAVSDVNYHFLNWSDGSTQNPRTDTNAAGDINVIANFEGDLKTLEYTAEVNGSLTGTTSQIVAYGSASTNVTAVGSTGYSFFEWSDGSIQNPRRENPVTTDVSVSASFIVSPIVTFVAGAGGTLTGTDVQTVNYRSNTSYVTAVPNPGYSFVNWSDGSTSNPYRLTNVTADETITANFSAQTWNLTYTSNGGGVIGGVDTQTVLEGSDGSSVAAIPDPGYRFLYWDDSSTDNPRKDTNVTTDLYMGASFEALMCGTITVGSGPIQSVSKDSKLYVLNAGENTITIVDTTTDSVIKTLTVGLYGPTSPIIINDSLYILNQVGTAGSNSSITIINTIADTIVSEIDVTTLDYYVYSTFAVLVDGYMYINNQDGTIGIFNPTTNTLIQTVSIGVYPTSAVVYSDKIFLIDNPNGLVYVFDTLTNAIIGDPITVGSSPVSATLVGTELFVVNQGDSTVSVIDTTAPYNVTTITDVGTFPYFSTLVGTELFVVNQGDSTVSVIDTDNKIVVGSPITVGSSPVSATLVGTELFVVNQGDNTVSVIDTANKVVVGSPITVGSGAISSTLVSTKLYVNNNSDITVSIIDTTTKAIVPCTTTYSAAYLSDANGTVTGDTFQTVAEGSSSTAVTAVPNSGYQFVEWSDNVTTATRTDTNIVSNLIVTAVFEPAPIVTYDLTYTAGTGGSLTGDVTQTVNENTDGTAVTAVPNSGYTFTKWSDDVVDNPRTDTNVTGNITVSAIFTVITSGGGGGGGGSTTSSGVSYACKDPNASNYNAFGSSDPSLCKYASTKTTTTPTKTLGKPGLCAATQLLTQNLKSGSRNGRYNSYTKGIVKEAKILQAHMNRLGFSSGKEDGILGPISDGAIKRMQTFLGTKADGYVGPLTRALINNSCGKK